MAEPPQPPDAEAPAPKPATFGQVVNAVAWSFFGIRKGSAMRKDAVSLKPQHVIIVGVVLAMLFVLILVTIAHVIVALAR
jgi:hypothetical protein